MRRSTREERKPVTRNDDDINNNNSIISKEDRFRLSVDIWGQIIDIYERKQRTMY
jgi:hypothetical protein